MAVTLLTGRPQAKATHCSVPVICDYTDINLRAVAGVKCKGEAIASPACGKGSGLFSSLLMVPPSSHIFPEYLCHKRLKKLFWQMLLVAVAHVLGAAGAVPCRTRPVQLAPADPLQDTADPRSQAGDTLGKVPLPERGEGNKKSEKQKVYPGQRRKAETLWMFPFLSPSTQISN